MSNPSPKRYLVTSALPYANGPQHVGHLTGAYLPADVYVRWLRLRGHDVKFVCGSDEYGAAITIQAKKENILPRQIVDKYNDILRDCFDKVGISFDIYHRTSSELHTETAQAFFRTLYNKGVFVEKISEQYYDPEYKQFLADRYIIGTCPKCNFDQAYGDQCERCGSSLSPSDLIAPRSSLSGTTPELRQTKHWYLPMGRFQADVSAWINETQSREAWKDWVLQQCNSWFEQGLGDRAMTRDLDWGVPVPLPDADGKVLYVWLDAPIGYISATKALAQRDGFDWRDYWQDKDTKLVHFIGKDNVVFHCVIFPMILQAHGNFILPTNVPANQFMNLEGEKMSTSRNYAVWLPDFLRDFPDQQDVLRYVLIANMPENKDSSFAWLDFQARNNNELVAIFGNFVHRVLTLLHKYYGGKIPKIDWDIAKHHDMREQITQIKTRLVAQLSQHIEQYQFRDGLFALIDAAREGNRFLQEHEPWKSIKTDPDQAAAALVAAHELTVYLAYYCSPYLPFTSEKLSKMLCLNETCRERVNAEKWATRAEHQIDDPQLLFKKIENSDIQPHIDRLEAIRQARQAQTQTPNKQMDDKNKGKLDNPLPININNNFEPLPELPEVGSDHAPVKSEIAYDDFAKLDIRTATIVAAERVPKADKLLKLTLELGFEQRTVVSGIAQHYAPEAIVGQRVLVLANLAPRTMRGTTSYGMILMAEENGKLVFVAPQGEIGNGRQVS
jgi:methionyl-tRNA synthetase